MPATGAATPCGGGSSRDGNDDGGWWCWRAIIVEVFFVNLFVYFIIELSLIEVYN